jgi:mannose/fructose/N-acetylgalactosamine-specific phosphotransferase system component IIC
MILHPIAAVFGVVSTLFGMLAHMSSWGHTKLTTCFASFAATFSLLAFIFDIVVFYIAKKRIESSDVGGSAELGNVRLSSPSSFLSLLTSPCRASG